MTASIRRPPLRFGCRAAPCSSSSTPRARWTSLPSADGWRRTWPPREKDLAQTTAKLGNEEFLAKAPDAVVDKIRTRQQVAGEEVERITARLAGLS